MLDSLSNLGCCENRRLYPTQFLYWIYLIHVIWVMISVNSTIYNTIKGIAYSGSSNRLIYSATEDVWDMLDIHGSNLGFVSMLDSLPNPVPLYVDIQLTSNLGYDPYHFHFCCSGFICMLKLCYLVN